MNTQKSVSYIKMFTALSGVRLVFSERELTFAFAMSSSTVRLSVCSLPVVCRSVTFVGPTQAIEIFGNLSTPFGTLAICGYPSKIL